MKRTRPFAVLFFPIAFAFILVGCSLDIASERVETDIAFLLSTVGTDRASSAFAEFDAKYGTKLSAKLAARHPSPGSPAPPSYPELTDMPFEVDGAVYLSGGGDSPVAKAVNLISPRNLPGGFYHGAILDIDKLDPNNLSAAALQTSTAKGADYESVEDWRKQVNVVILYPKEPLDTSRLNAAQAAVDYYCELPWDRQSYGFFKDYVNVLDVVTKEDKQTWYCTKVVWEVYKDYGLDIDSNDPRVDFHKSGLYDLVKNYFTAHNRNDPARAKEETEAYIADAKEKLVLAEEIYLSPYFYKAYERIRDE